MKIEKLLFAGLLLVLCALACQNPQQYLEERFENLQTESDWLESGQTFAFYDDYSRKFAEPIIGFEAYEDIIVDCMDYPKLALDSGYAAKIRVDITIDSVGMPIIVRKCGCLIKDAFSKEIDTNCLISSKWWGECFNSKIGYGFDEEVIRLINLAGKWKLLRDTITGKLIEQKISIPMRFHPLRVKYEPLKVYDPNWESYVRKKRKKNYKHCN